MREDVRDALDLFWSTHAALRKCRKSAYYDWIESQHRTAEGNSAFLVLQQEWVRPTQEILKLTPLLRGIRAYDLSELNSLLSLDRFYVCGATSLFPASLYCCGRSLEVEWAVFRWMKTELPGMGPGLDGVDRKHPRLRVIKSPPSLEVPAEIDVLDASGLWKEVVAGSWVAESEPTDSDAVPALEIELSDGSRTFAPVHEKLQVAIAVDSNSTGSIALDRKAGSDLVADDFIILRSYGEKDVIQELADKVLGQRAPSLRSTQAEWKGLLQKLREKQSSEQIVADLRLAGSPIADIQNLRNWMSSSFIRTQNKQDFQAIMQVTGMGSGAEDVWNKMGLISRAHIRAGMILRKQLTKVLQGRSGSQLLASGRIDVEFAQIDGGSLTAIRIERVGRQVHVKESQLLQVIEPWQ